MSMRRPSSLPQRGSALIIALIFLVVLAMLGITVASNNTLQERMAGNTKQRNTAFQAAEHALKTADIWMMTQNFTALQAEIAANDHWVIDISNNTLPGFGHANDGAWWRDTANWPTGSYDGNPPQPGNVDGVTQQPVYVIERMPDDTAGVHYFRVTALGFGRDTNAIAIVQAMYQFP